MAKAIVPIKELDMPDQWRFPLALEELFESEGVKRDDMFTYTTRYTVDLEDRATIERLKSKIRESVDDPDQAERFIALMEKEEWDVSFLVDTY